MIRRYSGSAQYIADVAGGKGLLTRTLSRRGIFVCELIDPRKTVVKGIVHRAEEFRSEMADYYDLLVGLHPDEALAGVGKSGSDQTRSSDTMLQLLG